jgi:hypothetical protein
MRWSLESKRWLARWTRHSVQLMARWTRHLVQLVARWTRHSVQLVAHGARRGAELIIHRARHATDTARKGWHRLTPALAIWMRKLKGAEQDGEFVIQLDIDDLAPVEPLPPALAGPPPLPSRTRSSVASDFPRVPFELRWASSVRASRVSPMGAKCSAADESLARTTGFHARLRLEAAADGSSDNGSGG